MDWAIRKKDVFYTEDGGVIGDIFDVSNIHDETIFLEEGCPRNKLYKLLRNNNKIFLIDPKIVLEYKKEKKIKKTDKNDVKAIYILANKKPKLFKKLTKKAEQEIMNEVLVKQYIFVTKSLARIKNMSKSFKRQFGFDNSIFLNQIKELEKQKSTYYKKLGSLVKLDLKRVSHIKGLGNRILAEILFLKHPKYFDDWRQYIKYCGFYADGRKTGKFNHALKDAYYLAVRGIIMNKDEHYSKIYYDLKKGLRKGHPEKIKENEKIRWNNGHIDNIARNRVATQLSKDVWQIFHED